MAHSDVLRQILGDVRLAFGLLTRLPLPATPDFTRSAAAAWAYPLVGLGVAGLALCAGQIMAWVGADPAIIAAAILLTSIIVTGAMHEDGLADCADGFWGGWDVGKRLSIMKDSQIGTYGVLALIASLLLRWYLITQLASDLVVVWAVVGAAVMSRAAMVGVMAMLPHAREDGLSRSTGRPGRYPAGVALISGMLVMAIVMVVFIPGISGFWLIANTLIAMFAVAWITRAKIGGQTGDVLGATQQIAEIVVLASVQVMFY